jgi:hypothetical protein
MRLLPKRGGAGVYLYRRLCQATLHSRHDMAHIALDCPPRALVCGYPLRHRDASGKRQWAANPPLLEQQQCRD